MHARIDLPEHLLALAVRQQGILHHTQLTELPPGTIRRLRGVVATLARALTERRTTPGRLLALLSSRERVRHRSVIEDVCGVAGHGIESVLEWRYLERVEQRHSLAKRERQSLLDERARLDGMYREFNVSIELDGRAFHDASKDMVRDNRHVVQHGMDTLRYGWYAVTSDPCAVAAQVAQALTARGWRGNLRICPDCPTP